VFGAWMLPPFFTCKAHSALLLPGLPEARRLAAQAAQSENGNQSNGGKVKKPKEQAVLVTTEYRAVFFGYMTAMPKGGCMTITRARNCVYWSRDVKGFLGLADAGPTKECRVGPSVSSLTVYKVTAVVQVSDAAALAWEKAPWG